MKSVRKYDKGGKQKGTVRAGKDYTNDKQAIAAGVTIDYSDPFRNLTEKDRAFLKKNLAGYGEGGETKIRMSEGGSRDGGYYNAQQVANARKALLKQTKRAVKDEKTMCLYGLVIKKRLEKKCKAQWMQREKKCLRNKKKRESLIALFSFLVFEVLLFVVYNHKVSLIPLLKLV